MNRKTVLYPITGLDIGGAEKMLVRTLPLLQGKFDNHVCALTGRGPIGKELEKVGIPVYYLEMRHPLDFRAVARFGAIIRTIKPDVMVTLLIHADLFGRVVGRWFGIKEIVCSKRGALRKMAWLDRISRFLVTHYLVQTPSAKQELIAKLKLPANKITVIPNGIDVALFNFDLNRVKFEKEIKIPSERINIVCVANLKAGKGHVELLSAFDAVWNSHRDKVNLLLVGDGLLRSDLTKQARQLPSSKSIFFLGLRDDVKKILHVSDIFVLPTESEGMSNALLEAMASKLAIVTTDIPVNRDLITDAKTGLLVPVKNEKLLACALEKLVDDEKLRCQLGAEAYQTVMGRYQQSQIIEQTIRFYSEI